MSIVSPNPLQTIRKHFFKKINCFLGFLGEGEEINFLMFFNE